MDKHDAEMLILALRDENDRLKVVLKDAQQYLRQGCGVKFETAPPIGEVLAAVSQALAD